MAITQILGRYLTFKWGSGAAGGITSIDLSVNGKAIDVSNFDSADFDEYIAGRKNWTMSVSVDYGQADTAQLAMINSLGSGSSNTDTVSIGPSGTPATGDVTFSGSGILTKFDLKASDADKQVAADYSIQGTAALTVAVT